MLVVKIELWPNGNGRKRREIARMKISNVTDSSADAEYADYRVRVLEGNDETKAVATGEVSEHPRLMYGAWNLVQKAIEASRANVLPPPPGEDRWIEHVLRLNIR